MRGRWAPSPTGDFHLGSARTALVAWLDARASGGRFVWRIEDIDGPRVVAGSAQRQLADLAWLGLDWDEGPDRGGPHAPYRQSERRAHYDQALEQLARAGRLFPCQHSRRDLEAIASAPHGPQTAAYPAALRPAALATEWFSQHRNRGPGQASLRFLVDEEPVHFVDAVYGPQFERVDSSIGDFVLERRDGLIAYQLAVVVDDIAMGINTVVRGADLLDSTARQIQLTRTLGATPPRYAHVPLVLNSTGEKLSKRDRPLCLAGLAAAGVAPQVLVGALAMSLGLRDRPEPCCPAELLTDFDLSRLRREPWVVPTDFVDQLLAPTSGHTAG